MKQQNFITEYCQILDESHGQRPDRLWFSTWMASKSPYFGFAKKWELFWTKKECLKPIDFKGKIMLAVRLCVTLLSLILKALFLKAIYRNELKKLGNLNQINVVRTFTYLPQKGLPDPFWGELIPALAKSPTPLLVIFEPQFSIFKCKRTYDPGKNNFPYQVFLNPKKLIRNYCYLLAEAFGYFEFSGPTISKNQKISSLITSTYKEELLSPASLVTMGFYDCFYSVMTLFEIQNFYLTFENNPWEKMCYLARQDLKQKFKIIGFQHATIQKDAANYFLSDYETKKNLYPNSIKCVGETSLKILQSYPWYKNIKLELGCALRHPSIQNKLIRPQVESQKLSRILVALDGTLDTVKLLYFILEYAEKAASPEIEIRIKEHPNLPLENFYPQYLTNQVFINSKVIRSKAPLEESLDWCQVLIYSGTTVSLEALVVGKPLIHYKSSLFDYDPIFQFENYKYNVQNLEELKLALEGLNNMPHTEKMIRSQSGKNFVKDYFFVCTAESIKKFLSV